MPELSKPALTALLKDAAEQVRALDRDIEATDIKLRELRSQRLRAINERRAFVSAYERIFKEVAPQFDDDGVEVSTPARARADFGLVDPAAVDELVIDGHEERGLEAIKASDDWDELPRTQAVAFAIEHLLASGQRVATPKAIEDFLHSKKRDDPRDHIGAALAYLNKKNEVLNVGRGEWIAARPVDAANYKRTDVALGS